jgi:DNA topoisomerase-1
MAIKKRTSTRAKTSAAPAKRPAKTTAAAEPDAPAAKRRASATAAVAPGATRRPAKAAAKTAAKTAATKGARAAARRATPVPEPDDDTPLSPDGRALVIVESPAKAKTIGKYLGRDFVVKATVGHVRDLPEKKLGIDVDGDFEPEYVTIEGKEPVLTDLKKTAKAAREIFIATDPDREGEAIGWHVAEYFSHPPRTRVTAPIRRVMFHEITKDGVKAAMAEPREINRDKVDAQQARRVLDRLVGYKASPILWKTVKKGLSAGRVQTVALRLIVEREREIRAFVPTEYWSITAQLEQGAQRFAARLHQIDGKKTEIPTGADAERILADVRGYERFAVTEVKRRERRKNPAAPFTTSTLQQEGAKKLGFGSKRTMRLAQDLYEGVDIGAEGAVGLITYMRTDSSRVAESAALAARDVVRAGFGEAHLAAQPQLYGKAGANTQDAHEGIRPTDPARRPEQVKKYLTTDQFRLYELVWQRFIASQMAPAVFDTTTVDFLLAGQRDPARQYLFRATGSVIKFAGFLALYREAREETEGKALEDEQALPALEVGDRVPVREIVPQQHFTEPPPRFSEASLVKELERLGIGRPSTYASIISVLADRRYVLLEQRRFFPTPLGESVEKVMVRKFPDVFNVAFTSQMEEELDKIEEGALPWQRALKDFWSPFQKTLNDNDLDQLIGEAYDLSALATERCPQCGGRLVPKGGFFGPFVACEHHPKTCKYTRPVTGERKPAQMTDTPCPLCQAPMVVRHGRGGDFLGCSRFPKCRGTKSMPTGVKCPKDGGDIAERRSKKRGKTFYGCENYPGCDFVCWDKPVVVTCPECGKVGAEAKKRAAGAYYKCLHCTNEWERDDEPAPAEAVAVVA